MKVYTLEHYFDGGGYLSGVVGSFREALGMVPRNLIGRMFRSYDSARDRGRWSTSYDDAGLYAWYEIREWEVAG